MTQPTPQHRSQRRSPVRILYIAGAGRSGSTILGKILNEIHGFDCLGEVALIWQNGIIENQSCACREPFAKCPQWGEIMQLGFGGQANMDGRFAADTIASELRTRSIPATMLGRKKQSDSEVLTRLGESLVRLYEAARAVTGARVIVDTSKSPMFGRFLTELRDFDVRVLHLVRDPRAVAFSYRRKKLHPVTGNPNFRMSVGRTAALWTAWNAATLMLLRRAHNPNKYMRVRYEDFVQEPQEVAKRVVQFAGEEFHGEPFDGPARVRLGPNHIHSGNLVSFQCGPVDISADLEWNSTMSLFQKALATALSLPLLRSFGYSIIP